MDNELRERIKKLAEKPCRYAHEGHKGYLGESGSGDLCPHCDGTGKRWYPLVDALDHSPYAETDTILLYAIEQCLSLAGTWEHRYCAWDDTRLPSGDTHFYRAQHDTRSLVRGIQDRLTAALECLEAIDAT